MHSCAFLTCQCSHTSHQKLKRTRVPHKLLPLSHRLLQKSPILPSWLAIASTHSYNYHGDLLYGSHTLPKPRTYTYILNAQVRLVIILMHYFSFALFLCVSMATNVLLFPLASAAAAATRRIPRHAILPTTAAFLRPFSLRPSNPIELFAFSLSASSSTTATSSLSPIHLVASDVDGTLLTSRHTVSSRTVAAIRSVQQKGIRFIVATGKSRGGVRIALGKLGEELTSSSAPGGVYLQGLIVYKGGEVVYERTLEAAVALDVMAIARKKGISLIAFNGDRILCEKMDESIASVTAQHEPMPEVVPLEDFISSPSSSTNKIHKLILLGRPSVIDSIRPSLASYLGPRATLTQAQGDMLEVLPPGGSKGLGVQKLLEALKVDKANLLAIGDQENDLEMLKMAGTAVAMGNAPQHVKAVAGFQTRSNDEDGAARAFERFCLDIR